MAPASVTIRLPVRQAACRLLEYTFAVNLAC